jgi:hypothetical protein
LIFNLKILLIRNKLNLDDNKVNQNVLNSNRENSINYSLEEHHQEKINWLLYLATPRILFMVLRNGQNMPFIFKLIPSKLCHSHMIEHYILQWSEISTLFPV